MSELTFNLQRECGYSQNLAVDGTDGDYFKHVTCWRRHSRAQDWYIAKSVVRVNGEIPIDFSEEECSKMPFIDGFVTIYTINAATGRKEFYKSAYMRMSEGTAGSDYVPTSNLSVPVPYQFNQEGAAFIGDMAGYMQIPADGKITGLVAGAQEAPLGQNIIMEIFKNGTTTGETVILAPGDTNNPTTVDIDVAQGDIILPKITQIGDLGTGIHPYIILNFQKSN